VNKLHSFFFPYFHRKPPWLFARNPDMKMTGRAAAFCGTKEKREKNELGLRLLDRIS
jgi:hypothetical protein